MSFREEQLFEDFAFDDSIEEPSEVVDETPSYDVNSLNLDVQSEMITESDANVHISRNQHYSDSIPHEFSESELSSRIAFSFYAERPLTYDVFGVWSSGPRSIEHSTRSQIFLDIRKNFENLSINFQDLRSRQLYYLNIKSSLANLWEIRTQEDEFNELLVLINQFIGNNHPENLESSQVEALQKAFMKLQSELIDEDSLEEIFDSLVNSGLDFFPSIKGFSELYSE